MLPPSLKAMADRQLVIRQVGGIHKQSFRSSPGHVAQLVRAVRWSSDRSEVFINNCVRSSPGHVAQLVRALH